MSDLVERQLERLRKQCPWQRAQGTVRDNGYPYHKHVPDCEICRAADLIEQQEKDLATYYEEREVWAGEINDLQARITELEAEVKRLKNESPSPRWDWEQKLKEDKP